jgi:hypothetical protein
MPEERNGEHIARVLDWPVVLAPM